MYAKCGSLMDARQVFDTMPKRNSLSWNAMIAGYVEHRQSDEALELFWEMQRNDVKADKFTITSILKACANLTALEAGKRVHAHIMETGLDSDAILESALLNMYARCGSIADARRVFDKMPARDVFAWNAMITGYVQHGRSEAALELFNQMRREGVVPNVVSWNAIIRGFAQLGRTEQALEFFYQMQQEGVKPDVVTWNAMITGYCQHGHIEEAFVLFRQMEREGTKPDLVSWNAVIAGYTECGHGDKALKLYQEMQQKNVKVNKFAITSILKACASVAALEEGKQVHAYCIQTGIESDIFLEAALVDMYVKCGSIEHARFVFDKMSNRDVVSWTVMIAGYAQFGHGKEALVLFRQMQREGVKPDVVCWNAVIAGYAQHGNDEEALELFRQMRRDGVKPNNVTFTNILSTCASLAALEQGKQVHADIAKGGLESDLSVGNALVDMYAKCGRIDIAHQVFEKMTQRDVVSWNTMIAGYAMNGHGKEALQLFNQLQQEGLKPDCITFVSVLSACSHVGLVDEGFYHFDAISQNHGLTPTVKHYACMLDILGHVGFLNAAVDFISKMPFQPDAVLWTGLLSACRIHGNVEIAEMATECVLKVEPKSTAPYLLLSNIYASAGRWQERADVRKVMNVGY